MVKVKTGTILWDDLIEGLHVYVTYTRDETTKDLRNRDSDHDEFIVDNPRSIAKGISHSLNPN